MSNIGKTGAHHPDRVIPLFRDELGYRRLGVGGSVIPSRTRARVHHSAPPRQGVHGNAAADPSRASRNASRARGRLSLKTALAVLAA